MPSYNKKSEKVLYSKMCYTRLLAPTHEKKSRNTEGSVRPVGTLSPGLDDSFSDASSFISESVCSTLTDLNADQGKSDFNPGRKAVIFLLQMAFFH